MLKGETFAQNLRAERARHKLSRIELSHKSGVNASTIEKLENGRQNKLNTTLGTISYLAQALNIEPQKLIGWE